MWNPSDSGDGYEHSDDDFEVKFLSEEEIANYTIDDNTNDVAACDDAEVYLCEYSVMYWENSTVKC